MQVHSHEHVLVCWLYQRCSLALRDEKESAASPYGLGLPAPLHWFSGLKFSAPLFSLLSFLSRTCVWEASWSSSILTVDSFTNCNPERNWEKPRWTEFYMHYVLGKYALWPPSKEYEFYDSYKHLNHPLSYEEMNFILWFYFVLRKICIHLVIKICLWWKSQLNLQTDFELPISSCFFAPTLIQANVISVDY